MWVALDMFSIELSREDDKYKTLNEMMITIDTNMINTCGYERHAS